MIPYLSEVSFRKDFSVFHFLFMNLLFSQIENAHCIAGGKLKTPSLEICNVSSLQNVASNSKYGKSDSNCSVYNRVLLF